MVKRANRHESPSARTQPGALKAREPAATALHTGYYRGDSYRVEDSVGYLMKQVVDRLSRAIELRMVEHSLTDAQWRPLLMLSQTECSTTSHMARTMGCDAGATTRLIDRLEEKGLVHRARSTDDRRVQQLELTKEGAKVAALVPHVLADVLNAHLSDLSYDEIDQLRALLQRVLSTARRLGAPATESTP